MAAVAADAAALVVPTPAADPGDRKGRKGVGRRRDLHFQIGGNSVSLKASGEWSIGGG